MKTTQLPLPVTLPDDETFASFVCGDNHQLLKHLKLLGTAKADAAPQLTYIAGDRGAGKSHLLFSLCHAATGVQRNASYIALADRQEWSTELLGGLENSDIICIDDVHLVAAEMPWQLALFDLINRVKEQGRCKLVISGNAGPTALRLALPDLQSRLAWGISFQVQPLNDKDKITALRQRAGQRGLALSYEVARFLCTHWQRDMPALMATLDSLDTLSLQEKRRLTIPFVKKVLAI